MSSNIKLTPQRKAIFDCIKKSSDHPTAADIIDRLAKDGYHFAYGTVYNSLKYLTEVGLIHELKLGDAASRYDGNTHDHYHLLCQICGRIDEVDEMLPSQWLDSIEKETNYALRSHQVILKGICPSCRESGKS
ncbi:MAG: Fur family transcriptional regulator [Tuberibacillus sp.]